MAKKKESTFKNWNEVDNSLKQMGELQIQKSKLEGEMTLKVNEIKEEYKTKTIGIQTKIDAIKKDITRFCDSNKDAFVHKRSKKLNFGIVAYRISEKVICNSVKVAINALKQMNLDFCLRVKEEIDKEKVKEIDKSLLTKAGISIVNEDKLSIEPNMVEIAANIE